MTGTGSHRGFAISNGLGSLEGETAKEIAALWTPTETSIHQTRGDGLPPVCRLTGLLGVEAGRGRVWRVRRALHTPLRMRQTSSCTQALTEALPLLSENGAGFKNTREMQGSPCRGHAIGLFLSAMAFADAGPEPKSRASARLGPASMPPAPRELSLMLPRPACRPPGRPLGWTQDTQFQAPVRASWGPRQTERVKQTFHQ